MAIEFTKLALGIAVIGLTACNSRSDLSNVDSKSALKCMAEQKSKDDYILITECEPLNAPEHFSGIWTVGFEESAFQEDLGSEHPNRARSQMNELVVPGTTAAVAHARDASGPSAYQISFVGRRSALPHAKMPRTIVLDRVISIQLVQ